MSLYQNLQMLYIRINVSSQRDYLAPMFLEESMPSGAIIRDGDRRGIRAHL